MKKVLALVLAVMMLSTMAFAVVSVPNDPAGYDDEIVDTPNTIRFGGQYAPGATLYVYRNMQWVADSGNWVDDDWNNLVWDYSDVTPDPKTWNAEVTSANYSVTNQRWTIGKELLAGLEFDDKNNQLKIKLTEDYTLKQPKVLRGSFVLKAKGKGGTVLEYQFEKLADGTKVWVPLNEWATYNADPAYAQVTYTKNGVTRQYVRNTAVKPNNIKVIIDITIGNWKQTNTLYTDTDTVLTAGGGDAFGQFATGQLITAPDNDLIYNNAVVCFGGASYGTVVINCADDEDTEVTFRAYSGDQVFLHNNTSSNDDLLKAYADQDAEISFLNFVANPVLNSTATVRFYKDEGSHVYVMKDGKLVSEVKWDDDEDCFVLKTRTLGSYVFSDKALKLNAPSAADTNPDTGANDVVGIATALAAVALVSAAAVSLKK